ncbi:DNA-binding response regulator [Paenibacillus alkalitolerans]|uniref:DNA-binding response regulator n=1 Tax=Paenibacillus alkalitolerans TaxID=2799335 RepID=UPI0018F6E175|nr:DNA-binding response regulator [Paenibacillus alkalitolerans]
MTFDQAYESWFSRHLNQSSGERKRRLVEKSEKKDEQGNEDYPEKLFLRNIWWPLYGSLEHVHPEYEVIDFAGKTRFLDEALVRYPLLVDMEVDGYGPHLRDISRWDFSDERRRDPGLEILGWNVIRFSFDDVKKKPLECQHLLKHWMGRWTISPASPFELNLQEREIVKLALSQGSAINLSQVMKLLSITDKPARKLMKELVNRKVFSPVGVQRIHVYTLNADNGVVFPL